LVGCWNRLYIWNFKYFLEYNTNANRYVGQVNLADDTANEWYITGVQLEAGTTASDFEFLPVDVNLARCQRYYYTCRWKWKTNILVV
jgi:hypothetical protein